MFLWGTVTVKTGWSLVKDIKGAPPGTSISRGEEEEEAEEEEKEEEEEEERRKEKNHEGHAAVPQSCGP